MDFTAALSSAKTAFELAHALQNGLARGQVKQEEVPARLMELQQHILSMQAVVHDLAEENRRLHIQVEEFERSADFGKDFKFEWGVYWREKYPYCPICWDSHRKPTRLSGPLVQAVASPGMMIWTCSVDKGQFSLPRSVAR